MDEETAQVRIGIVLFRFFAACAEECGYFWGHISPRFAKQIAWASALDGAGNPNEPFRNVVVELTMRVREASRSSKCWVVRVVVATPHTDPRTPQPEARPFRSHPQRCVRCRLVERSHARKAQLSQGRALCGGYLRHSQHSGSAQPYSLYSWSDLSPHHLHPPGSTTPCSPICPSRHLFLQTRAHARQI